jgi:hypothetical protein
MNEGSELVTVLGLGELVGLTGWSGMGVDGSGPWVEISNPARGYMLASDVTLKNPLG